MSYVPSSPFEKFVYYHGKCKAYLNKPKPNDQSGLNYLTSECATLLGCYLNVSRLAEPLGINNLFEQLCIAAAREIAINNNISRSDALASVRAQALKANY